MKIAIVAGTGEGRTLLSAFDAAMWRCGVHDYNLLPLSSVIPPGSLVVADERPTMPAAECGHRLYVVKAEVRSARPGAVLAAGLGWLQWGDGRGVFVEHEAESVGESCQAVEARLAAQIRISLRDLAALRAVEFVEDQVGSLIAVTRVGRQPTSALVLAIYQAEGWRDAAPDRADGPRQW